MSPTKMIKKAVCTLAMALCAVPFWNCGSESPEGAPTGSLEGKTASVALRVTHVEVPLMDSIVVECVGADSLHLTAGAKDARFDLDLFPHDHWKFRAMLYANGALMQKGEIEMKLEAGSTVDVSIPMHALVGFVYVEIPLGFGNPAGIASGTLTLASSQTTFTYPMETSGLNATFKSEMLALGLDYAVTLSLRDSSGVEIYSMLDTLRIDENTPVPELSINSLRAKTKIALQVADDVELQIPLTLPATRRKAKEGDLVISEFLVNSKNDSIAFDFVEVYNGSNDTLLIGDCFIGKTSALKESSAIRPVELPPRRALAIGSDSSEVVPEEFRLVEKMPAFNKSNSSTASSIVFHCDGDVLDSVYYGKVDSLHLTAVPLNSSAATVARSSQLNIGAWDDRENPENWSLGNPTPGKI